MDTSPLPPSVPLTVNVIPVSPITPLPALCSPPKTTAPSSLPHHAEPPALLTSSVPSMLKDKEESLSLMREFSYCKLS